MKFLCIFLLGLVALSQAQEESFPLYHQNRFRRGAATSPASAGGYNIGNKGSTYSVSSALGAYNTFTGNIGVQGAYGAATYDLGAALGAFGPYLNEGGGGGYGGGGNTYGYGGSFFSNKNR
ncbi:glycine-rich cell wall structural protein-like [Daphnia pulex]|uniref:glycine-rich cell wall structural protein-like n=1 Tax=Daphnia pulex TaxID=6669 RepID=UPI001EDE1974|nr:glycine-rich cell wall structural protein-like [Daphnia pulex]XP_046642755.1 glycine-rich cell wall structural protein-like [Daphnia pulicaria]